MKAALIKIGNSQGIRIPKPIIDQCGFGKEVQLTVRDNCLIISAEKPARLGWDEYFKEMAQHGDDKLVVAESPVDDWDKNEWTW